MNTIPPLSEAILLATGAVKEIHDKFFEYRDGIPCGCAIGTAMFSIGQHMDPYLAKDLKGVRWVEACERIWPWTAKLIESGERSIASEINRRHFELEESRESIAAWLIAIEPQEAPVGEEAVCQTPSMIG